MKRWSPLAVFSLIVWICAVAQSQTKTTLVPIDSPDVHPQYFPKGAFSDSLKDSDFEARWYSKHLRVMAEPSLLTASKDGTLIVFRFLWLRTFHYPIAIRMTVRPDGTASITAKVTSGHGGYEPGRVVQRKSVEIPKTTVAHFFDLLQSASFWSLRNDAEIGGNDGAQWILEGLQNGTYRVIVRWSPKDGDYRTACLYLLELSGIKV